MKQSPFTAIVLLTPSNPAPSAIDASVHGTTIVGDVPSAMAAVTSSAVTGAIVPLLVSAMITLSDIFSPQITFASSLSSLATSSAEAPPSYFLPAGFAGGGL